MERDFAFEALAESTGTDWSVGRGELNAALKSIREQSDIEDALALSLEIHERALQYREVMPDVILTPSALAKHWSRVKGESAERHKVKYASNLHAPVTACSTCGGDRFVVVAQREPQQSAWMKERGIEPKREQMIEEMAPCPDCGPEVKGTPDPAKTREMMSR